MSAACQPRLMNTVGHAARYRSIALPSELFTHHAHADNALAYPDQLRTGCLLRYVIRRRVAGQGVRGDDLGRGFDAKVPTRVVSADIGDARRAVRGGSEA